MLLPKTRAKYPRQSYLLSVIKSGSISTATNATKLVLFAMAWVSEFDAPTVKISKSYIQLLTGLSLNTIKTALRWLRTNGVIAVINGETGGRGVWPTYEIREYTKGGKDRPPLIKAIESKKGANGNEKGGQSIAQTGADSDPHSKTYNTSRLIKSSISKFRDAGGSDQAEHLATNAEKVNKQSAERILRDVGFELNVHGGIICREDT